MSTPKSHEESVADAMDTIMGDQEPGDSGERVVQIAVQAPARDWYPQLYILTNRGTLWVATVDSRGPGEWERIRLPEEGGES